MAGDAEYQEQGPGVLHLGEVRVSGATQTAGASGEPPAPHPKRRWVIMVAVFLVGVMVGGYAWLARSDLLGSSHVELIAVEINHDAPHSDGALTRVIVHVRNLGENDVTITRAQLPSQTAEEADTDVSVPAGETAAVAVGGELNCGAPPPDAVDADVQTPAGETSARIPLPRTNFRSRGFCGSASPDEVWVETASTRSGAQIEPGELTESGIAVTFPLGIRSWGVREVEIVDVDVSTVPGLDVVPSGLVGGQETGTVVGLRLEWSVTDCSSSYLVEPIDVTITFADHPPATLQVPGSMLPMLQSLPDMVCGS